MGVEWVGVGRGLVNYIGGLEFHAHESPRTSRSDKARAPKSSEISGVRAPTKSPGWASSRPRSVLVPRHHLLESLFFGEKCSRKQTCSFESFGGVWFSVVWNNKPTASK